MNKIAKGIAKFVTKKWIWNKEVKTPPQQQQQQQQNKNKKNPCQSLESNQGPLALQSGALPLDH